MGIAVSPTENNFTISAEINMHTSATISAIILALTISNTYPLSRVSRGVDRFFVRMKKPPYTLLYAEVAKVSTRCDYFFFAAGFFAADAPLALLDVDFLADEFDLGAIGFSCAAAESVASS